MPLSKAPSWWYEKGRNRSRLLAPVGTLYGALAELRWNVTSPYHCALPVICVGNFTVGGAGKTPTAIAIAALMQAKGEKPVFLSRGYKGRLKGPHLVDPKNDAAQDVGDEPLLLAKHHPTIISKKRPLGAKLAETLKATVIIMDDGFQNPTLAKDFSLAVIDAEVNLGNSKVFPAGPLRAPLSFQLKLADALLAIGDTPSDDAAAALLSIAPTNPFLRGQLQATEAEDALKGEKVIAYCGIGRPEKFFQTVESLGAEILARHSFPDHYVYTQKNAEDLLQIAKEAKAKLVTTQKDLARLSKSEDALKKLSKKSKALEVRLTFRPGDEERLLELITKKIDERKENAKT